MLESAEDNELHEAVRLGDPDMVEGALAGGLDPNTVGMYQWCPLHEAASNGDLEVLQLLLKFNADPNKADRLHSYTPLHYAAREGHPDCLMALIKAGGRYDAEDSEGATPLDLAEDRESKDILDRQRTKQFLELSLADAREVIRRSSSKGSLEDVSFDLAPRSTGSSFGRSTPTAWETIEVVDTGSRSPVATGTGLLQSSFEYNSKSRSLKVRVWQVEDILMPPAEFSSISRVYVKGHLLPDKKGETKRKTEEVKIEEPAKMASSIVTLRREFATEGFKAIYLPSTFKFTSPLVYRDIPKEMLPMRTVHLDVCVRMRYSTKSFPVASFQIPLSKAVCKLRKEKFRLLPCINYTAPDNVHSADPTEFVVTVEGLYANRTLSVPALQKRTARVVPSRQQARATSDINLKNVRCHSVESIPTVSLSVSSEGDMTLEEVGDTDQLTEVKVHRTKLAREDLEDLIDFGDDNLTMVDIHQSDSPLPGSTANVSMAIRVESRDSRNENNTTINLNKSVSETSFIRDLENGEAGRALEVIIIPRILVTTPNGEGEEVGSVTIEMEHLMRQKRRGKTNGGTFKGKDTSKSKSRRSRAPQARPGHVIDMRDVQSGRSDAGDTVPGDPQRWAISSSPPSNIIRNKAFDVDNLPHVGGVVDVEEELSGRAPETSTRLDSPEKPTAGGDILITPEVNYAFVSEEMPKSHERSPRSSPTSSPKRRLAVKQKSSENASADGSRPPRTSSRERPTKAAHLNSASSVAAPMENEVSKKVVDLGSEEVREKRGTHNPESKPRTKGHKASKGRNREPQVNFGFISEEGARTSVSSRVSPMASPLRIVSSGSGTDEGKEAVGERSGLTESGAGIRGDHSNRKSSLNPTASLRHAASSGGGRDRVMGVASVQSGGAESEARVEGDHSDRGSSVNPRVNYISEETPRGFRSPKGSPTAAPKCLLSSQGIQIGVRKSERQRRPKSRGRSTVDDNHEGIWNGGMKPKVNFGFISEESPRQRISPRNSPTASPKRHPSPRSSLYGDMTGMSPSTSKPLVSSDSLSNSSPSMVEVVNERDSNRRGLMGGRGKPLHGSVSSVAVPPSPLIVQENGGARYGKARSHRYSPDGEFERPEVRRSIDFSVTPPLTEGLKTTDLVLPGKKTGRPSNEESELNLYLQ